MNIPRLRIGNGFDVHRLVEGRKCIICGVEIPYQFGLLGHSDADVALHALTDAILGAAALGDIGAHFPDTDPQWEGADSRRLLRLVVEALARRGWAPGNVDLTVIAQEPRMAPYIDQMRANIAADLGYRFLMMDNGSAVHLADNVSLKSKDNYVHQFMLGLRVTF